MTALLTIAGCAKAGDDSGSGTDSGPACEPSGPELCDGMDNDCDGSTDEGAEPTTWFPDGDGDGYGTATGAVADCAAPLGYVDREGDCDDSTDYRHPGRAEVCDGLDNDCDASTADSCSNGCTAMTMADRVYLFCSGAATWATARAVCRAAEMDLVKIDDAAENSWISANAGAANAGDGGVWLRANDIATEGGWIWADGDQFWAGDDNGSPVAGRFASWSRGEPNDAGGKEDCGETGGGGQWNDVPCDAQRGFICERD